MYKHSVYNMFTLYMHIYHYNYIIVYICIYKLACIVCIVSLLLYKYIYVLSVKSVL